MKSRQESPTVLAVGVMLSALMAAGSAWATPEQASKYYEDARARYDQRDLPGAALQLKNAIQQDRGMLAAHMLLSKVLLEAGQLPAAEASLEEALTQGVSRAEVLPLLGRVYLQVGEPSKLLDRVDVSGLPPALHGDLLTLRGTALAMIGNLPAASSSFEMARNAAPQSAGPLVAEAPVLLRFGDVERAAATARKATQLEPGNAMAWHQLGNVEQARGNRQAALAAQDKALALLPKLVDAHVARVTLLIGLDRKPEAAALLKQLQDWKVVEPRASYLRASLQAAAGDAAAASASWNEAVNLLDTMPPALRSTSEPLLLAGALSHRALGSLNKAREYLETLLVRNPRHLAGRILMATFMVESNDLNKAASIVDDLLRQAPDEPQILYLAGTLSVARRQYEQANQFFERAQAAGAGNASLRELAFSQFALGKNQLALTNLEKALANDPKDVRAGIELAIAYARQGQSSKALRLAESILAQSPDSAELINFLGNIYGRLSDNKNMRMMFERALSKDPQYRPTVINLSRLDIDENRLDSARARLAAWSKTHPKDVEALYFLGAAERRAGRMPQAQQAWERAVAVNQRDLRSALALVDLLLELRRPEDALKVARPLSASLPSAVTVQHALARVHMAMGRRDLARAALKEALKLAGYEAEPVVQTGRLMLAISDLDGAAYAATKALQASPGDLGAMLLNAEVAGRRGDAKGVDRALAELEVRHPGTPQVLLTAGHVALSRRQFPKALDLYKRAYEKEPAPPVALLRARTHLAAGQTEQALAIVQEAQRRFPDDDVLVRALAQVRVAAGKTAEAVRDYEALIGRHPDDAELHGAFAELLFGLGDARALPMAAQALKLDPSTARHGARHGWMLVLSGDLDGGVRALRDARLRDPADGRIRWQLAEALHRAGKTSEARDELRASMGSANPPRPGPELDRLRGALGL